MEEYDDDEGRYEDADEESFGERIHKLQVNENDPQEMQELYQSVMDTATILPMKPARLSKLARMIQDPDAREITDHKTRGFGGHGPFDFEPADSQGLLGVYKPAVVDQRLAHFETHADMFEQAKPLGKVDNWLDALTDAGLPADSELLLNDRFLRGLVEFSDEKYTAEQKAHFFTALCEGLQLLPSDEAFDVAVYPNSSMTGAAGIRRP